MHILAPLTIKSWPVKEGELNIDVAEININELLGKIGRRELSEDFWENLRRVCVDTFV